jgi:hypothetical protein
MTAAIAAEERMDALQKIGIASAMSISLLLAWLLRRQRRTIRMSAES